jgi:hypothetical protein
VQTSQFASRPFPETVQQKAQQPNLQTILQRAERAGNPISEKPKQKQEESIPNQTGLPDNLKAGVENLSGYSLDNVRVHYNSPKPAQLQALAYTQGTEIHVAPGQEKHLPHEAWHVVQQMQGRVKPMMQMKGVQINNDEGLEKEADVMGVETTYVKSPSNLLSAQLRSPSSSTIQCKLNIGNINYSNPKTIIKRARQNGVDETILDALVALGKANELYTFNDWKEAQTSAEIAKPRLLWWESNTEGIWILDGNDPLFKQIANECIQNHDTKPYSTDALHETGPIMHGWMNSKGFKQTMWNIVPNLFDKKAIYGKEVDDRPDIEITSIQMIKNKALLEDYEKAKKDIESRNQGKANEKSLYSGHGIAGTNFITDGGHDPSYGQYDTSKGHGAHGRGAYFTDQVDKAISYSSKDQKTNEERSFFKQDVLLGNTYEYTQRGAFRHWHHNEMVKSDRNQRNKARTEGIGGTGLENYDSLTGKKTYEPGSGIFGTIYHMKQFDSNEFMVRNADQIYVKFRIFYKLK